MTAHADCIHETPDPFQDPEFVTGYDKWLTDKVERDEEGAAILFEAQVCRGEYL